MCGIAGIIDLRQRRPERRVVERMCRALAHRGPDDEGYWLEGCAALGQRRLSIIDLSQGHQPLSNEDGSIWVTFNGEIYNYQELRARLMARGHRFTTHCDTEVIVHAYEEYGAACVHHFRGMFAFAVWDTSRSKLFIARDRVGKKPLFYLEADGEFLFASELQALLANPAVRRVMDPTAIDDYLSLGYVPAPKTAFMGIRKLPPAHHLTLSVPKNREPAQTVVARYWQLAYGPKLDLSDAEAKAGLLEVLTKSVRLRLMADVPLGALLSGGVDSSVVVALMSRLSDRPVKTFSIGFDEREFDELPYARLVAKRYGTEHHELIVRADATSVLPTLVRHYGEPFADSSAIPSYFVAQITREHVKVALNGDGGDECLGGYDRYFGIQMASWYRRLPTAVRRGIVEPLAALVPGSLPRRNRLSQIKRFLKSAALPACDCYARWLTYFGPSEKQLLYSADFKDQLAGHRGQAWLPELFEASTARTHDPIDAALATDMESYLPYDLLVKMDIATMAHGLEARSPFLDHQVLEYCARLPARFKRRGRVMKYLLKELAGDLLPSDTIQRRKMGFGVPLAKWIRNDLRAEIEKSLFSSDSLSQVLFAPSAVRQLFDEHITGRHDHSARLWALHWLELWHREFLT